MADKLRVTQIKSTISHTAQTRATVRALGLHGIGETESRTRRIRGMVTPGPIPVTVEESPTQDDESSGRRREAARPEARRRLAQAAHARRAAASPPARARRQAAAQGPEGARRRRIPAWFEGGQTPIHMRVPKLRGFKNRFKIDYAVVNVGAISEYAAAGRFGVSEKARQATGDDQRRGSARGRPHQLWPSWSRSSATARVNGCSWSPTRSPLRPAEDRGRRRLRPASSRSGRAAGRDERKPHKGRGRRGAPADAEPSLRPTEPGEPRSQTSQGNRSRRRGRVRRPRRRRPGRLRRRQDANARRRDRKTRRGADGQTASQGVAEPTRPGEDACPCLTRSSMRFGARYSPARSFSCSACSSSAPGRVPVPNVDTDAVRGLISADASCSCSTCSRAAACRSSRSSRWASTRTSTRRSSCS